jgi:NAD(P)-dependent dehydrogenase (short-subunit alcohol dehydrogenase family)
VVCVDLDAEGAKATAEATGGTAMTADVSSEADVLRVVETAEAEVGPIDLFCSNAGIGAGMDLQAPNEEWQRSWDVNVSRKSLGLLNLVEPSDFIAGAMPAVLQIFRKWRFR